jgi:hypothetical protein
LGSQKSSRLTVWQYRQEFFEAAQRKLPAIGRYLWRYGMQANGEKTRTEVIQAWQNHFHLRYAWAFECAWMTLLVWDRHPEHRHRRREPTTSPKEGSLHSISPSNGSFIMVSILDCLN